MRRRLYVSPFVTDALMPTANIGPRGESRVGARGRL